MSWVSVCSSGRILPISLKRGMGEILKNIPRREIFKEFNLTAFKRNGVALSQFIGISVGSSSLLKINLIKLQ